MLKLENIEFSLDTEEGPVRILQGIDLHLEKGKKYALTGPNGSGKSSLARVIMGITLPTKGRVLFNNEDITELGITERARKGIGYAFQHPPRFKGMQVRDILEIAKGETFDIECKYLRQIGLCPEDYLDRPLDASLSGGEIKRIEIATLLAQNPQMRVFDEPEAGIDLWSFERLINVIDASHLENTTTVLISHQEKIIQLVDEMILIEDGKISMKGDKDTVWPQIKDSFATCACRQKNCPKEVDDKEGDYYAECSG